MSVHQKNAVLASMLRQIAALLDEKAVPFKPNAYRKAAQVFEDLPKDVAEFKDEKELMELPGIGEAIASKTREFVRTGRISFLDQLLAEQGGLSAELMMIENLGPKRVRQFQKELGITTIEQLVKAAEEGKLRSLERMSELMERKILESAKRVGERNKRFSREEVIDDAEMLLATIKKVPGVERAEVAGSFRRQKPTIGDLDVIVVTKNQKKVADAVAALPIVRDVVAHGETKVSFNMASGLRVDVRFVGKSQWGSALLYFTGDKEHNISLRKRAIERGWKLNEYALTDEKGGVIASKEEKDIYKALNLPYIEPTGRTSVLPR
jgi:DNA polymerase (family 10)